MNVSIDMNQLEFIIASVVGPIVAAVYFTIKIWINNKDDKIIRSK